MRSAYLHGMSHEAVRYENDAGRQEISGVVRPNAAIFPYFSIVAAVALPFRDCTRK